MSGIAGLQDDEDDAGPSTANFGDLSLQDSEAQNSGYISPRQAKSPSQPTPAPLVQLKHWTPPSESTSAPSKYGGGDKCVRCHKTVYFAECKEGPNHTKYHKSCFACKTCGKTLDSLFNATSTGEIYCKNCYSKEFAPKGFGFGGAVDLNREGGKPIPSSGPKPSHKSPTSSPPSGGGANGGAAPSKFGGGDKCPRCEKTVYFAEAKEGPGGIKYHKSCFVCSTCKKMLDHSFTENKGNLYCKGCYAKEHGPNTFGYS